MGSAAHAYGHTFQAQRTLHTDAHELWCGGTSRNKNASLTRKDLFLSDVSVQFLQVSLAHTSPINGVNNICNSHGRGPVRDKDHGFMLGLFIKRAQDNGLI